MGVHKLHNQSLNNWELIVINYLLKLTYISCSQHTSLDAKKNEQVGHCFLRNPTQDLRCITFLHAMPSPKPYLRRTSSDNLLTKLNHEACILWNWICISKFTENIDSLQKRTFLGQEISKTYLKCNQSIEKAVRIIIFLYCFEFIRLIFFNLNYFSWSPDPILVRYSIYESYSAFIEHFSCARNCHLLLYHKQK